MRTDRKLREMLLNSTTSCVVNYDNKEFNKVEKYLSRIKHTKSPKRRSKYLNIIEKICLRRLMRKFNKLDNDEKIDIFKICNIFESIDLGIPQEYKYIPKPPVIAFKVKPLSPVEDDDMSSKANLCKALRQRTGAGMMECKKALTETDWDMDKAEDWLKKQVRRRGI